MVLARAIQQFSELFVWACSLQRLADMKRSTRAIALVTSLAILHATNAHAEEGVASVAHHRSSGAYGAGIALTVTGSLVLAAGTVLGVGGLILAGSGGGDNGGLVAVGALGIAIWAGAALVGAATLAPGIVLMVKNAPAKTIDDGSVAHATPVFHDARADVPAPRFMSIPILSGSF